MELLLVRHAEPVRVELAEGRADPVLHERGRAQAGLLAGYLAGEQIEAVYTSPLRRAVQTADVIADSKGLRPVVDEGLSEFDRDASFYIPMEELRATKDERFIAMTQNRFDDYEVQPEEFRRRVVGAIERIIELNPSRRVAVVCHGGVINAYLGHILGIERLLWFEPRYSSIARVAAARSGPRSVLCLNETSHLRGTGLLGAAS